MDSSQLPSLRNYPRDNQFDEIIANQNNHFNQTCSDIEFLLKDSRRRVLAFHPTEKENKQDTQTRNPTVNNVTNNLHSLNGNSTFVNTSLSIHDRKERWLKLPKNVSEANFSGKYAKIISAFPINLRKQIIYYKMNNQEFSKLDSRVKKLQTKKLMKRKAEMMKSIKKTNSLPSIPLKDISLQNRLNASKIRRKKLENDRFQELEYNVKSKQAYIDFLATFTSPNDRQQFISMRDRTKEWLTIVVLALKCTTMIEALWEDRIRRKVLPTNDKNSTLAQVSLFELFHRRLRLDLQIEERPNLEKNNFIIEMISEVRKRKKASEMIQTFFKNFSRSQFMNERIHHYFTCIRKCQRYIRTFLVCRNAKKKLIQLQLEKFQQEEHYKLRKLIQRRINHISEHGVNLDDNLRQITELQIKLSDPETFFKIPEVVYNNVILDFLRKKRFSYIKSQIWLSHSTTASLAFNFKIMSKFVRSASMKTVYDETFPKLLNFVEIQELYKECIYESQQKFNLGEFKPKFLPESKYFKGHETSRVTKDKENGRKSENILTNNQNKLNDNFNTDLENQSGKSTSRVIKLKFQSVQKKSIKLPNRLKYLNQTKDNFFLTSVNQNENIENNDS